MAKTSALQFGRIVWANVADASGATKLRPAIILTSNDRIASLQPLEVVAITSRLPEPLPDDHVLLPWHPQRHPRTGLNRRCAGVCHWLCRITPEDVKEIAGVVPGQVLLQIVRKVEAIQRALESDQPRPTDDRT